MDIKKLRDIPKVDLILNDLNDLLKENDRGFVIKIIREILEELRQDILSETNALEKEEILENVKKRIAQKKNPSLQKVINGTGIILHTNLGRAVFCEKVAESVKQAAMSYSTLEYDLNAAERGSRYSHIEGLLCELTGAEAAMAVNNNAGAVMLMLSSMAKNKEVIVSRGELVEIGGAFRVPVMMQESGASLVEVGTTNKTHPEDYVKAIDPEKTGALLKVHASNFSIVGFTEEVSIKTLCEIGKEKNIPVLYDLGSGSFCDLEPFGLPKEKTVKEMMDEGVDLLSFSGDKMIGGPQAGILLGKKKYIDAMKKHPLARILRIDKMSLAALETTLRIYLNPQCLRKEIPTLGMIMASMEELKEKGEALLEFLEEEKCPAEFNLFEVKSQVGGGSLPKGSFPSLALGIKPQEISLGSLEKRLREGTTPIISRISKETLFLDLRTLLFEDLKNVGNILAACLKRRAKSNGA